MKEVNEEIYHGNGNIIYFLKKFNGKITESADISQFDHFIYAAKFKPIFPMLMIIILILYFHFKWLFNFKIQRQKIKCVSFLFGCYVFFYWGQWYLILQP